MALFVLVLVLLLAASVAQDTPDPDVEAEVTEDGEVQYDSPMVDVTDNILTANNNSAEFLLEGDLIPPRSRNAMTCWYNNNCLWPKGSDGKVSVPYVVDHAFGGYEKRLISFSLKKIEGKTCIRFVPRQWQRDYVKVVNQGGCFSSLGKTGGQQVLSLNRRGCVYEGVIQHEFLHALGFKHEQTRSDRDQYVRINWQNMQSQMAYNFYKSNTNNLGTSYDYSSIMHYGRTAFSINGRETITPIPDSRVQIGQRQSLSEMDIERVNLLYKC